MRRSGAAWLGLALLAGCDKPVAVAPTSSQTAIAAAERKAVGDVDAALAEARVAPANAPATGTNGEADRLAR